MAKAIIIDLISNLFNKLLQDPALLLNAHAAECLLMEILHLCSPNTF